MADAHSAETLKEVLGVTGSFSETDDHLYVDPFQTQQQRARDEQITKLLTGYVEGYQKKQGFQQEKRRDLYDTCTQIIRVFAILFVVLLLRVTLLPEEMDIPNTVSFVTVCISFLTLVIGLLQIITRYCFPENDEEYVTKIVQSIQENDLKHKLANIDYDQKDETEKQSGKQ